MDKYIVSQWNKYQHDLKNFYNKNIKQRLNVKAVSPLLCKKCKLQTMQFCDTCSIHECGLDAEYRNKSVVDVSDDLISNLLDKVINAGEESKGIRLLGYYAEPDPGLGLDLIYLFEDKNNSLWISKVCYSSYDCAMDIPATTKEEWISIFMNVSLTVIQNMRNLEQEYELPFRSYYNGDFEFDIISGVSTKQDGWSNELYKQMLQNNGVDCKYLLPDKDYILIGVTLTFDDIYNIYRDEDLKSLMEKKCRNGKFALSGNSIFELMTNLKKIWETS